MGKSDSEPQEQPQEAPRKGRRFRPFSRLFILIVLAFAGFCVYIDYYGHIDQARTADAIVILGARVNADHQPGDSLRARTKQAVALYQRGLAPKIICTGGLGDYAPTEAKVAAELAMKLGVPAGDLLQEDTSTNTRENAANTAVICKKQGWTRVVVVSDPYHLWRARRDFAAVGLTAYTSPALTCIRDRKLSLRAIWTAREGVAVSRDILFTAGQSLGQALSRVADRQGN